MKNTALTIALLITITAHAQVDVNMRIGYATKTVDVFIAPGIAYTFQCNNNTGIRISTEIMAMHKNDAPINVGFNMGYKISAFEFGGGIYYMAYSLDKYDFDKNHFAPNVYVKYDWKRWFVKAQYLEQVSIGIGIKEIL